MSTLDHIADLRARGGGRGRRGRDDRAASRSCGSSGSAGRPSCPTSCAPSPSCRPRSAAPSAAPPTRRARRSTRSIEETEARLEAGRARAAPGARPRRRHAARHAAAARRAPAPAHRRRGGRSRTSSSGSASGARGPEVETVHYNFDALNHAAGAPGARAQRHVLHRPTQRGAAHPHLADAGPRDGGAAAAALRRHPGPRLPPRQRRDAHAAVPPGRRLAVDEDITLADLKGTLLAFSRAIFGADREVRLRPHFFPFTEPERRGRLSCFHCGGTGPGDGARCRCARASGWIEILGAGMVHPNVFGPCAAATTPSMQGFAFGMGIERIAMLRHGIPDIRLLHDNDLRFLEQFGWSSSR